MLQHVYLFLPLDNKRITGKITAKYKSDSCLVSNNLYFIGNLFDYHIIVCKMILFKQKNTKAIATKLIHFVV